MNPAFFLLIFKFILKFIYINVDTVLRTNCTQMKE
ncbi:hypothetical protein EV214_104198 [Marinisporobacter balticus]|uniref:Uncharacterized protein n=1 Tax=Marinisporobacter balticus TaxID=2018667 RepID=A0A4R2KWB0_9FIRM|nr:hypothetical protein EV214_104198 [Marinisporobacter balticus]